MNIFDFYIPEQILVAFSLIVLMFVLTRILWKPLTNIIDSRQKDVDDMLRSADEAKAIIADMEKQRVNQSAELERLIADKTNEACERAGREYNRIVAEAEEKAHNIVKAGEEKAAREYQRMMSESQEAVIKLALGAAAAIVESSMDSEKNRALIDSILRKSGMSHG
ncbi:MAG: ATP synthase F0 subunit B [Treponema sp.]|jgi:F-type H+-transporting ATPase subunit b|nr:ATP synthase F0 subunit B [Treponema sp.]